jgi:DNA-binding response OmpR family regulator
MTRDPTIENRPVLLIEDDPDLGEVVMSGLVSQGYHVTWAHNWTEGQVFLNSSVPDLLILDLSLPDGDGIQILHSLRNDIRTHDLAVVITSARNETCDLVSGIQTGAFYYVTKPYDLDELLSKARSAVFQRFEMPLGQPGDYLSPLGEEESETEGLE